MWHAGRVRHAPGRIDRWRRFVARYGWRAYALPALAVITVLALVTGGHSAGDPAKSGAGARGAPRASTPTGPPTAATNAQLKSDQPTPGAVTTAIANDALPAGSPYTLRGAGTFRVLRGGTRVVGSGPVHRYTVELENGITSIDVDAFAAQVDKVLDDPRSWSGHGVAVQRVDSGRVDFRVTLTSAMTVRQLCGYSIPIETSCYAPDSGRVVINDARWVRGDPAYIGDLDAYRTYMINHEDGHALGHQHAHQCLPGGLAPVMMQQTIGLKSTTGQMCQANPWPYPPGAAGAPGVEAADTPQNSELHIDGD